MKIRYEFVNGDVIEIEGNDEIGMTIIQSRKEESSDGRQYRRQTLSLDAVRDKSDWVKTNEHNPDVTLDREELEEMRQRRSEEIREIMNQLSDKQTELAQAVHDKKFTQECYAEEKGVSQSPSRSRSGRSEKNSENFSEHPYILPEKCPLYERHFFLVDIDNCIVIHQVPSFRYPLNKDSSQGGYAMTCICSERALSNPTRQVVPAFAMTAGEDNDTSTAVFGVDIEMWEVKSLMTWTHRPWPDETLIRGVEDK